MFKLARIFFVQIIILLFCIDFGQSQTYFLHDEINIRIEKVQYNQELFFSNILPYNKSLLYDSVNSGLDINTSKKFWDKLLNKDFIQKTNIRNSIHLNPILLIAPGYSTNESGFNNNYGLGLSLSGAAGDKFAFQFNGFCGLKSFQDELIPQFDTIGTLPHLGKYFSKNGNNFNYTQFTGYLSYSPYQFLNFDLGMGKHFWGDGYRSLFLSDNSASFPYLKTSVSVWKLRYIWLFGVLSDKNPDFEDDKMRSKFLITHLLSYNTTNWLNLSFFESIVSNPTDSAGIFHLNPGYLNPVIFFRPVEFSSGSADNAFIGLSMKIKLFKKFHLYGQFIFDEFIISEIKSGNDWWGNKFGYQAGLKIFDLFAIPNLFLRFEYNLVRPYTYSYYNSFSNYGNRFQPLAHPMGANFKEIIAENHYHKKRFSLHLRLILGEVGTDSATMSFGQNIYKSNVLRVNDYGIKQGQGLQFKYMDIALKAGWIINHKMNITLFGLCQYMKYPLSPGQYKHSFVSFGISSFLFNQDPDIL